MRVYHTSTVEIALPDLIHSREYLDFGRGFYMTTIKRQAENYGQRFIRRGDSAVMNVYELDEVPAHFSCKKFESLDGEWLDYIACCRKGLSRQHYDMIEGGVADDQVFDTVDLYLQGIYSREQALGQLSFKRPNFQICIANQQLLEQHLHFVESVKLM